MILYCCSVLYKVEAFYQIQLYYLLFIIYLVIFLFQIFNYINLQAALGLPCEYAPEDEAVDIASGGGCI